VDTLAHSNNRILKGMEKKGMKVGNLQKEIDIFATVF